ncbi:hypothetical protein ACS4RT_21180 [Bacillus amyloliquefaciens]
MNENQSAFNTAKQTAQRLLKCKNEQEMMDFLAEQDVHTLSLLKYYYSAPALPFQMLMKIAFCCIVMALIFTSFLFIQVKTLIPIPILSDLRCRQCFHCLQSDVLSRFICFFRAKRKTGYLTAA